MQCQYAYEELTEEEYVAGFAKYIVFSEALVLRLQDIMQSFELEQHYKLDVEYASAPQPLLSIDLSLSLSLFLHFFFLVLF